MERIKDLSKVVLRGDTILAEVVESVEETKIIIPDTVKNGFDHLRVIAVGYSITDILPGDILIDVAGNVDVYPLGNRKIATLVRHNVLLAVHPDNFDMTLSKKRLIIPPSGSMGKKFVN